VYVCFIFQTIMATKLSILQNSKISINLSAYLKNLINSNFLTIIILSFYYFLLITVKHYANPILVQWLLVISDESIVYRFSCSFAYDYY